MKIFDELYVVSDIHLGGEKNESGNFQIFKQGDRLGGFITQIADIRPDEEVGLVLNGDIIDSLAEEDVPGYIALDPNVATAMMNRIYADPSFKPVWDGLEYFISKPKRHLILVIGNHDIELALPVVEDSVRQRLAGTNNEAQSRIYFATRGGGFACKVGKANVFCTHGNEVDEWNWVDYSKLGELANATNAGRIVEKSRWEPNAGTRLVIDIMNTVKRRFPFVDLLKPEVAAVAGILLALDKNILKQIDFTSAIPITLDKKRGKRVVSDLLADDPTETGASTEAIAKEVTEKLLGPSFQAALKVSISENELLFEVEKSMAAGTAFEARPVSESEDGAPEVLGIGDIVAGWVGLVSKPEALRRALLDWIKDDKFFEVDDIDALYTSMQERVGDGIDFVITGHTHKAIAWQMQRHGFYYNCGTWIRLLRLTTQSLENEDLFEKKIWPVLTTGDMDGLDNATIPGPGGKDVPLFFDRTNAVRISKNNNQVVGDLLRVTGGEAGSAVKIANEPGTRSFKV